MISRVLRLVLLVMLVAAVAGTVAPTAGAHANLVATSPANDQVIALSPSEVRLRFDEPVERSLASVTMFDGDARRVALGRLENLGDRELVAPIRDPLDRGTFTVIWRSISVDGHAINGYFVFHVGSQGPDPTGVIGDVGEGEPTRALEATDTVTRFVNLALTLLVIGGIATGILVIRGRSAPVERRIWHVVAVSAVLLALVAAWGVLVQAAKGTGTSVGGALDRDLLGAVLSSPYGTGRIVQIVTAALIGVLAVLVSRRVSRAGMCGAAVVLSFTPGLAGHAGARGTPALLVDGAHVLAAASWVGGLATTCLAVVLVRHDRFVFARNSLAAFSRIAMVAVAALVVSGAVSGLLQLGGIGNLWSTSYGRLILVKIVIAAVLVALAWRSRHRSRDGGDPSRPLGPVIAAELALMLVVVAVTTQLVAQPPARVAVRLAETQHTTTLRLGTLDARVTVVPVAAGPNTMTVVLLEAGRSVDADEVRVAATNRERGLGPIRAPAVRTQPGTYVAATMPLIAAGDWDVTISVRRGEFDQWDEAFRVTLR